MVGLPQTLSDHPSLVGIVRFPNCNINTQEVPVPLVIKDINGDFMSLRQVVDMASNINGVDKTSNGFNIPKSKITDFYPYTYYVLTDGEADPLIMLPQYMPNSCVVKGEFALSHQPIERYYVKGYKGDNNGTTYNITNVNQMMLPTATNEGLTYMNANANTIAQTRKNQVNSNVLNAVNTATSAIATGGLSLIGGGVSNVINGLNAVKEIDARNKDTMLTPTTISSFGTPSTRQAFKTDNVRLLKFSVKENIKNKINNFTERYGNKFNNYATIDLKSYKGYLKMISPDLDTKIDNMHVRKIIEILERGVYIE